MEEFLFVTTSALVIGLAVVMFQRDRARRTIADWRTFVEAQARKTASFEHEAARAKVEAAVQRERAKEAEDRASYLSKYERIVHAEAAATQIIERAEERAKAITSSTTRTLAEANATLVSLRDEAERLEATNRALTNIAEGYGANHLVPVLPLLDEALEDVGDATIAEKLAAARDVVRELVTSGHATACEEAELARRRTAEQLVLDAFNGRVAGHITAGGTDFGTLSAKIEDAAVLVNASGAALGQARVTEAYVSARIEEARWAVAALELQATRKERAEEAKRGTDGEASGPRLQTEANATPSASEEAIARASTIPPANVRAGFVYVASNVGTFGANVLKIGCARRFGRSGGVDELEASSVPFGFDLHATIDSEDAPALVKALHRRFAASQVNKVDARRGFFRIRLEDVRAEVEAMGIAASWTADAPCRDYKETLAIEAAADVRASDVRASGIQVQADEAELQSETRMKIGTGTMKSPVARYG